MSGLLAQATPASASMHVRDVCCGGEGSEETKAATPAMSMSLHSSIFGL